jgi:hypothetical protein
MKFRSFQGAALALCPERLMMLTNLYVGNEPYEKIHACRAAGFVSYEFCEQVA